MYVPRPFAVDDDTARELLRNVTVGNLVTSTEQGLLATMLPWVLSADQGALQGHLARPNPQWSTRWRGEVLVLAQGPNGYVSPSWYPTKAETGRVVPTWDYVSLQVHGELVVHDDAAWVEDVVRRLTDRHEQSRAEPWSVSDAPADYLEGQIRGIVGVEVLIDRLEVSVKMSQNKSAADAAGVVAGFAADGNEPVAEWVRRSNR